MTITLRSEIEKHAIKLPEWVHIPEGTRVKVSIETEIGKEDQRGLAKKLCGAWADDPSIDSIFKEIEKERHSYYGRGIDLDTSA